MRTFIVYDAPHRHDPVLLHPVIEVFEDGSRVGYSDLLEIKDYIKKSQGAVDRRTEICERMREKEFGIRPRTTPKPIDTNPFDLIEGNENKLY